MLNTLSIEQFAIIEKSEIRFQPGFNILTGETGAGKSILIDAIGHILGERADASLIRKGADKADIQAHFSNIPKSLQQSFEDSEHLDPDSPDEAHLRRTIREKGSKIFINSQPATAAKLKEYAGQLVNIHGQHANQALLQNSEQRRRVDRFGKLDAPLNAVKEAYRHWKQLEDDHAQWLEDAQNQQERLELLSYQLEELNAAAPKAGEFAELESQHAVLASADEILTAGSRLNDLIYDGEPSIASLLRRAEQLAEELAALNPACNETLELISQSSIYLNEAHDSLTAALSRTEHDPEALEHLDNRMSQLYSLARKHKIGPEELHGRWQELSQEFEQLQNSQTRGTGLEQDVQKAKDDYLKKAAVLTAARQTAAAELADEAVQWIRQLGMEKAEFTISVIPAEKPAASGMDNITFLLCANPGQDLQPLAKTASGGELSRISLAIETACLDDNAVPHTLIFDEIDAGIGGEVADTVGRLLAKLSQTRQVLCITHLPQVAVYAAHHFRIEKTSDSTSTQTKVIPLDDTARIQEIARMLGSAESESSLAHAKIMLEQREKL